MLRPQLVQAQANKEAEEARQDACTARREAELLRIQLEEERAVTAHAGALLSHAGALAREGQHPRPPLPHCHSASSLVLKGLPDQQLHDGQEIKLTLT